MENRLKDLFQKAQEGNKDALLMLIEQFMPLINKYKRKLDCDGSETDLLIKFIEIVKSEKTVNLMTDKQLIKYIETCIRNEYIRLSKNQSKVQKSELLILDDDIPDKMDLYNEINIKTTVIQALNQLTSLQREIIIRAIMNNEKEKDIASDLNISQQAVNKAKNKALEKLKNFFDWRL
ncbi:sigma-70 family RNA polymerase sigma factor [Thermoanaerobacterium butyriciformans]|uniref:RNA polymerase sigma factor (Sigma-70 family) n=1 Tax=Thermoanaerobacterium butyriciformans TaxID=1702242 RepID=A0ABS4NAV0_9THEO|nr:sigma-70 family RNA polymerase sigma factor [Thermoanaerobacterium butyriciformans]MBP2070788.1 RNA polymerase sigma factor (sigma-70 family) [Thermoanaerobacterium butyriciformans]